MKRTRILLVEDEAILAMSEKMQLEKYGYGVTTVRNGENAVEMIKTSSDIDLVLMDIDLGKGIDGTQTAEIILEDRDIPIVFLSSHTEPAIVERTEKISSYGYVVKNSNITVLDVSIKMALKLFDAKQAHLVKEAALAESENRFHDLFERAPLGYQSLDSNGRFLEVNLAWLETLGYDRTEVIGEWFGDFLAPEYVDVFRERFPLFLAQGRIHSEFHMRHKDGKNRFVAFDGRVGYNSDKSVKQTHCILKDETERKQMESALKESVSRHHELVTQIPVGVYIVWIRADGVKEFEYVSDRWCEIHGLSRETVLADSAAVIGLVHPDDRESFFERNRESEDLRKPFFWEGRFFRGNRELCWLRIESKPLVRKNGDIRWFGITQDITEQKQSDAKLAETLRLLSRAQEIAHIGSWQLDLTTNQLTWSDEVYRIFGCKPQEFPATYESFLGFVHPDDRDAVHDAYSLSVREGSDGYEIVHRIVLPDSGEVRVVHERCDHNRDGAGNVIKSTGMVQDITHQNEIQ
jgi:PAS domain S-box-containing protein